LGVGLGVDDVFFDFVFGGCHGGHSGYPGFLVVVGLPTEELAGVEGFGGTTAEDGLTGSGTEDLGPSPSQEIQYEAELNEI
jgi:hypothetical protein